MKSTIIPIMDIKKIITGKVIAIAIAGMLALPSAGYSQERDGDEADQPDMELPSTSGSGPWQNSAGSTIGTRDNGANSTNKPAVDPRLGPGAGTLGRPVTDGRGPGGNPDVPFDDNMNLVFLAGGIAFAFIAVRKRARLQAVPAKR